LYAQVAILIITARLHPLMPWNSLFCAKHSCNGYSLNWQKQEEPLLKNKYSRREALKIGMSTAALGVTGSAISAAMDTSSNPQEVKPMSQISEFNKYGEELEKTLILRTSPIAVKMIEKELDIPKGAIRPKKDKGYHLAQCQAFALSRREGMTVAMLKEDNWCPTSVIAYGLEKKPESLAKWVHPYECFERGKYIGIVSAPLKSANFLPDVVITYLKPAQLRGLLLSMKVEDVPQVSGHFFPPSCGWSVVEPMKTGKYWVVIPDPGEYQRALTEEGDMMFSVPQSKMSILMAGLKNGGMFSYREHNMVMQPDFEQPAFYKDLFKSWGVE
jgi:uncharacterized protein (DUF169 family)